MQNKVNNRNQKSIVDPDVHRLKVETPGLLRVGTKQYIYEFNPNTLMPSSDGNRIGICGVTGVGKSWLMIKLLQFLKNIPVWMILNPSEPGNHMYGPHVENEGIIHDEEDTKVLLQRLENLKARQIKRCKEWRVPNSEPAKYYIDPSIGCIADDICEDTKVFNEKIFGWLMCNSRNFKTFFAILVQYYRFLPKK